MKHQHLNPAKKAIAPSQTQIARHSPHPIEELQGALGNRTVNKLLANQPIMQAKPLFRGLSHELAIQPKLAIGAVGDKYEQEADRIAHQVVNQLHTPQTIQREEISEKEDEEKLRMKSTVQCLADGGEMIATPNFEASIQQEKGSGQPLPKTILEPMEQAFRANFSGVKVHADTQSDQLNKSIQAKAFTTGQDIFFRQEVYNPGSRGGQELIAHELTHVMQQSDVSFQPVTEASEHSKNRKTGKSQTSNDVGNTITETASTNSLNGSHIVQRLAYNDPPTAWGAVTLRRSNYGKDGVIEVTQGTDKILVKPVVDDPGNVKFANSIVAATGLQAPQMEVYPKGTAGDGTEGGAITALLTAGSIPNEKQPNEIAGQVAKAKYHMVMDEVQGSGVPDLNVNEAINFIQNANALQQIGRLMVVDTFLGNNDRLVGLTINWGNFLYQGALTLNAKVATIDNEAKFNRLNLRSRRNLIDDLVDTPDEQAQKFLNSFKVSTVGQDPHVQAVTNDDFVKNNILQGISEGLRDIANLFQTNRNLIRSLAAVNTEYGASASRDVNLAKGLGEYIRSRDSGTDAATAATKLTDYLKYRAKRDFLPKGLKWLSRPLNLGRGL